MILRNNMEDLILNVVDIMLQDTDDDFWKNQDHQEDLVCYVLNRVKPKYVRSGRGILHSESSLEKNIQDNVDLFSLVAEGMRTIIVRRKDSESSSNEISTADKEDTSKNYYFNFPCLVGKIISMSSGEELSGVKVTLKHKEGDKNIQTLMINSNWSNSYIIADQTEGYFTFFPKSIIDDGEKPSTKRFEFLLLFEHDKFGQLNKFFSITLASEKKMHSVFQRGSIHRIEDMYITE